MIRKPKHCLEDHLHLGSGKEMKNQSKRKKTKGRGKFISEMQRPFQMPEQVAGLDDQPSLLTLKRVIPVLIYNRKHPKC